MFLTGFKTAIIAALLAIFGALQGMDWATIISDPQVAGWVVSGIGVLMMVLRAMTGSTIFTNKTPVGGNVIRGGPGSFNQ